MKNNNKIALVLPIPKCSLSLYLVCLFVCNKRQIGLDNPFQLFVGLCTTLRLDGQIKKNLQKQLSIFQIHEKKINPPNWFVILCEFTEQKLCSNVPDKATIKRQKTKIDKKIFFKKIL